MLTRLRRAGIERDLHALVDRLCKAPKADQAQVFAELVYQASLMVKLEADLQQLPPEPETECEPAKEPVAPEPEAPPEPETPPVLTGPFVRLSQGGNLVLEDGSLHAVAEEDVIRRCLQHGDLVEATPADDGSYSYRTLCAGPMLNSDARELTGHIAPLDDDVAVAHCAGETAVLLSVRDMKQRGAAYGCPVCVRFLPDAQVNGRYVGRVLKVYPTAKEPEAPPQRSQRRKRVREAGEKETDTAPANLPQFDLINGRRPVVALLAGRDSSRLRLPKILEQYGADPRLVPDPPTNSEVEIAVRGSDIIIGLTQCCSHVQWDLLKRHGRGYQRLWLNAISQNPSGFRRWVETDLLQKWRDWISCAEAAD